MTKILFICHGNICRSPMAEFVFNKVAAERGLDAGADSAAMHTDELGNPVYPPARRILEEHGINCTGKYARLVEKADYEKYDLIIGMDERNMRDLGRFFDDKDNKIKLFMSFAGKDRGVADPWYTGNFEETWADVCEGCDAICDALQNHC